MKSVLIVALVALCASQDIKLLFPEDKQRKSRMESSLKASIKPEVQKVVNGYVPSDYYTKYDSSAKNQSL